MFRKNILTCVGLAASLVGLCGGCGSADAPAPRTAATPPATPAAPVSTPAANDEAAEIEKALAQLSPEDRAIAEKQKVCLVAGGPLGGMGKPIKVSLKGRDVFICCAGCKNELIENADKYLAKLDAGAGEAGGEKKSEPETKEEGSEKKE